MKDVIIIPTYNEKKSISTIVPLVFDILKDIYIVVADDNSPDGTGEVVLELQKKYPNLSLITKKEKKGLGKAYLNAFSIVLKEHNVRTVIMMDADFGSQVKFLPEMMRKSKDFSVVIGSRYIKGSKIIGWQLKRRLLSSLGNLYCDIILRMPIKDYTCGFVVISADYLRKVDFLKISSAGYAFILQLKYLLYKAGATFYEVPIVFIDRTEGESKITFNIINEGILAPWKK